MTHFFKFHFREAAGIRPALISLVLASALQSCGNRSPGSTLDESQLETASVAGISKQIAQDKRQNSGRKKDVSAPPKKSVSGQKKSQRRDPPKKGLIFRSGFESDTYAVLKKGRATDIRGIDHSVKPPNDWDKDLQPSGQKFWINYVDYDKGGPNPDILGSDIVNDPEGGENKVFYTWQKDAEKQDNGPFSRIQGEFNRLNWKEAYYKVRFRLGSDISLVNKSKRGPFGLSMVEFFTGSPGHHKLVRIILQKKAGNSPLMWRSEIQNFSGTGHTLYKSSKEQPKYDQWQTLEFYVKSGDANSGRYWVRLNGSQVLFDETVTTTDPVATQDIQKSSILKSYGGALVKEVKRQGGQVDIWFDDLEIWNELPPALAKEINKK